MDVHSISLIGGTLYCVLVFYILKYLFLLFLFSFLVDSVLIPLRRPNNWSWEHIRLLGKLNDAEALKEILDCRTRINILMGINF